MFGFVFSISSIYFCLASSYTFTLLMIGNITSYTLSQDYAILKLSCGIGDSENLQDYLSISKSTLA